MNAQVSVKVLNDIEETELKEIIESHLKKGYKIQDSQINWYLGKIEGVYVFLKEGD